MTLHDRPRRYKRRPPEIEAMHVAEGNVDRVAVWAGGSVEYLASHPVVRLPKTTVIAHVGDYIARAVLPNGLGDAYVLNRRNFEWAYERAGDQGRQPQRGR